MKYIVMECHEAYAVLMDEESRFFHAANLHYSVGQTVSSPVLMQQTAAESDEEAKAAAPRIRRIVMRASAIAAALLLTAGAGFAYYARNYKTQSVVVLNSDANIQMCLNKDGKVVRLKSENDAGAVLLESYDGLHKNKVVVAHELLALQKANGSISDGDTVDVYISAQNSEDYAAFKSEFETDISRLNLNVNVQDLTEHPEVTAVTEPTVAPEPPEKPVKPPKPDKPDKPGKEPGLNPPAKPEEHKKPEDSEKPAGIQPQQPTGSVQPVNPPEVPADPPVPPEAEHREDPKPAHPEENDKNDPKPDPDAPKPGKPGEEDEQHPEADPEHAEHKDNAPKKPGHPALPHTPGTAEEPVLPHLLPESAIN